MMTFKQKLFFFFFIFGLANSSFSQNNNAILKAHTYLIEGQLDSLRFILKKIPNSKHENYLKNIAANSASFEDYFQLMGEFTLSDKGSILKLNKLVQKNVKQPALSNKINLEYVKVRWFQILNLLNEGKLKEASQISSNLNKYIDFFKPFNDINFKKAKIYERLYPIVMYLIENKITEGKKLCLQSAKEAKELKDPFLVIFSKNYLSDFLVLEQDLEGFIANCKEIFSIESKQPNKSFFYESNVQHYLDAIIYKGGYNPLEIESLLEELYSNDKTKYLSFIVYAKYIRYQKPNSQSCIRIYDKFKVKNLVELSNTLVKIAKNNLSNNDLNALYDECSDALFAHGFFKEAYNYKNASARLTKKIYSEELSQSIADFETQEKELENTKLKQINLEKEVTMRNQRNFILGIFVVACILLLLAYFLYKSNQERNKINTKLNSANKDLERLNLLNQKIFSVISHDFKGSILTLSMLLNTFKKNIKDSYIAANINEVSAQFDNANSILNNLLNWVKAEFNVKITDKASSNVKQVALEIINQLKVNAENKNITFQTEISNTAVVTLPDDILRIVFRNLLSNAIKFSHENAVVKVAFDSQSKQLKITDSGIGIHEEKAATLFKSEVISSFGTQNEPGFGMGLYIVSELLHKYKVTIAVQSQLQKGTTFILSF